MKKTKVTLFCGGSGSESIIKYFSNQKNIELTLIVNAYDDGKSTGQLRKIIPDLLGPSDFRKNFSYLINVFLEEHNNLKKILEHRIKKKIPINKFYKDLSSNNYNFIPKEIYSLDKNIKNYIINHLLAVCEYLQHKKINLLDFSLGNLIFAGIYLKEKKNFNVTIKKFAKLINSNVKIINISNNDNRWLLAINQKGHIIDNEAKLVEKKQNIPIKKIFLIKKKELLLTLKQIKNKSLKDKLLYLNEINSIPEINIEAKKAILDSNYIIYGPGTQHSSLYPSYLVANKFIKRSKSKKILIMNLDYDKDINKLKTENILKQALIYLNFKSKTSEVIDSVLIDNDCKFDNLNSKYKDTIIKKTKLRNNFINKIHSGKKVYDEIFNKAEKRGLMLYVNLANQSFFDHDHIDQILDQNWSNFFQKLKIIINVKKNTKFKSIKNITIQKSKDTFPETKIFRSWLKNKNYDHLATISGDGFYDLGKLTNHINLMNNLNCGLLIGSRNQSRSQHFSNIKEIYGKNKFLYFLSKISEFFFIILYFLKIKFVLSDPNSGYRIYSKENISRKFDLKKDIYPSKILKHLVNNKTDVLEIPVKYYVKRNFSAVLFRFSQAFKNLKGLYFD